MPAPSSVTAAETLPPALAPQAVAVAAVAPVGAASGEPGAAAEASAGAAVVAATGWCAATRRWGRGDWTPEWFCAFLAGNQREQSRFRKELATMRGSVVWLLRQRRQGRWSAEERERLRGVMRSASSVSPYLLVWAVPGSLLLLPFMAWFIDRRRTARERAAVTAAGAAVLPVEGAAVALVADSSLPLAEPADGPLGSPLR
ncbi:hypothetical protein [Acidovorax sp. PRC11]|uniref:hypothetical protein n=1 Tax=Acidovorax sp. PRC11 TaxID=2962592 RepID=UPI002880D8F6|nr:hypothetical protein [Acidovorax sp. PRC11]MDT0140522.1 hypothetical protein [Acidovorax sp. PRC11]